MTGPVTVVASAKLTLTLRITGVRDDGFHLIDAEMVSLDIADEVTFREPGPAGTSITLTGPSAAGLSAGADNLVARALRAVGRAADVTVDKRIPHGGGLGGGSADAAAVFRWAGVHDLALAATIGADVPFCMHGGRARVRGIGQVLDPLPFIERTVTLAMPGYGCDTAAVYRAWDELGGPASEGPNDLEPAAVRVEPRLAAFRDALGEDTGEVPVLAGSGSTWFVPGAHPGPGRVVARTVPAFAS
jgi:4-diphosphocytidyl-2-C-methyl-D-erythritol kinase